MVRVVPLVACVAIGCGSGDDAGSFTLRQLASASPDGNPYTVATDETGNLWAVCGAAGTVPALVRYDPDLDDWQQIDSHGHVPSRFAHGPNNELLVSAYAGGDLGVTDLRPYRVLPGATDIGEPLIPFYDPDGDGFGDWAFPFGLDAAGNVWANAAGSTMRVAPDMTMEQMLVTGGNAVRSLDGVKSGAMMAAIFNDTLDTEIHRIDPDGTNTLLITNSTELSVPGQLQWVGDVGYFLGIGPGPDGIFELTGPTATLAANGEIEGQMIPLGMARRDGRYYYTMNDQQSSANTTLYTRSIEGGPDAPWTTIGYVPTLSYPIWGTGEHLYITSTYFQVTTVLEIVRD